tara:strand:- start:1159 stop:1398 length:240 start_codon:yes stop_codon:yes gene_type:complete
MAKKKLYIRTANPDGSAQRSGLVYSLEDADGVKTGKVCNAKPGDEVPRYAVSGKADPVMALLTNSKPKAPPEQVAAELD